MKTIKLFLILVIIPWVCNSQTLRYTQIKLTPKPERAALLPGEEGENYIVFNERISSEYAMDDNNEELIEYYTYYKHMRINNEKEIDNFNKVYIPLSNVIDIIDIQARSINSKGEVKEVDKNNIKEVENLENKGAFKIFAIEGIENGSDIEYVYTLKKNINYCLCGYRTVQEEAPIRKYYYELVSPSHLAFKVKSYNGLSAPVEDTLADGRRIITVENVKVPGVREEKYATEDANKMTLSYKFRNNTERTSAEQYTWAEFAQRYYNAIHSYTPADVKTLQKKLSVLKLKDLTEEEKIKKIEIYIKTNYAIKEDADDPNLNKIDFILKNRYSDERGIIILYSAFFEAADITCYLGTTTNRYDFKFDKDFMNWSYITKILMYFPKTNSFLMPAELASRYGLPDNNYINNNGLFIKPVKIGDVTSAVPQIIFIAPPDYQKTYTNFDMTVDFKLDAGDVNVKMKQEFAGYDGFQPIYSMLPLESKDELTDQMIKTIGEDTKIESKEVLNSDQDISPLDKAFTINAVVSVKSLLESAGDNYLFKVGALIGPQVEMYQENKRQWPVEIENPHHYLRIIRVNIPEGYTIKGLDKLNIKIEYDSSGTPSMGFVSSYIQEGNLLTITVNEFYRYVDFPIGRFEDFRKVINASADFNKITLILEKK